MRGNIARSLVVDEVVVRIVPIQVTKTKGSDGLNGTLCHHGMQRTVYIATEHNNVSLMCYSTTKRNILLLTFRFPRGGTMYRLCYDRTL